MTPSPNETLDRIARRIPIPEPAYERMLRRRDRKRRNQRIAAGVVGIAVFVAAVWIVTSGLSLDRSETSVVPGGDVTGPAETGPAVTGPIGTRSVWLPPKGAEPSTPTAGELVAEHSGIHPWRYIQVYADGRVIWSQQVGLPTTGWFERRLTPEGVDLVRSGSIRPEDLDPPSQVLAGVWQDPKARPYVPARYAVCATWSQATMGVLPQRTQDLLRGGMDQQAVVRGEVNYSAGGPGVVCPAVTIEEARALDRVFLEVGYERSDGSGGLVYEPVSVRAPDASWIGVIPLLPDGTFNECCPG